MSMRPQRQITASPLADGLQSHDDVRQLFGASGGCAESRSSVQADDQAVGETGEAVTRMI